MSKIVSIGKAVPAYKHEQSDILSFMQRVYAPVAEEKRKLQFLYRKGGIQTRYSVIPDYSLPANKWSFYPASENLEPFPALEKRMKWFETEAAPLSINAIRQCLGEMPVQKITHLITVSCTGMSAPGLDLQIIEGLGLPLNTVRSTVNFVGCYAAIQALRLANAYCKGDVGANVLVVCTELCTLHFQKEATIDNITSSMLFSDGSAAMLVSGDPQVNGIEIGSFYSKVNLNGKNEMAWQLSSKGFQMSLSSYVPDMIEEDFQQIVDEALINAGLNKEEVDQWCIHPGGKKILEAVHTSLGFSNGQLDASYDILREYGNMSSASVVFVLDKMMADKKTGNIFMAAFGPGLTMETAILRAE